VNEIRVLASVRHPHVVAFLQAFLHKNDKELCIIMEFCGCGDLAAKVERYRKRRQYIDERVIWCHLIQILEGLTALHDKGIVHRDLKTANCFLAEDGTIKIGDLNVCKRMKGNNLLRTQIGTPYYMSPEIWANRPYDKSADLWAVGCTIYELCALRPPFVGNSFPELKRHVQSGRYPSLPKTYSSDLASMIGKMIKVNPRERPTAAQMLGMKEILQRKAADWYRSAPNAEMKQDKETKLMKTIVVPKNVSKLTNVLPKACFPDSRPNSPEAWPVTHREREAAMARKASQDGPMTAVAEASSENKAPEENVAAKAPAKNKPSAKQAPLPIQPKGSAAALHAKKAPAQPQRHGNHGHQHKQPSRQQQQQAAHPQPHRPQAQRPGAPRGNNAAPRRPLGNVAPGAKHGGNRAAPKAPQSRYAQKNQKPKAAAAYQNRGAGGNPAYNPSWWG